MKLKTDKWKHYNFYYGHWNNPPREGTDETDEMKQFFRDFRSDLKKILKDTNFKIYQMKKNYYDVSCIISSLDETKFIYLSLGDMRFNFNHWFEQVLVRTMKNPQDYSGGMNHYCSVVEILETIESLC